MCTCGARWFRRSAACVLAGRLVAWEKPEFAVQTRPGHQEKQDREDAEKNRLEEMVCSSWRRNVLWSAPYRHRAPPLNLQFSIWLPRPPRFR